MQVPAQPGPGGVPQPVRGHQQGAAGGLGDEV